MLVKPSAIIILLSTMLFSALYAADAPETLSGQKPEPPPAEPVSNVFAAPNKTVTVKPSLVRTLDAQLSGSTSQDAEQIYGRLSLQETRKKQNWSIRASLSKTRTINGRSTASVLTSRLNSRLETIRSPQSYNVFTGVLSRRDRDYSKRTDVESGYNFISYGAGKSLGAKAKGDVGLGIIKIYGESEKTNPCAMVSLRGSYPLNNSLTMESDLLVLQPMTQFRDTKIDSELGLIHSLSPKLSLRLTWSLNNLVRSINTNREWDSSIRLSIAYKQTTSK